MRTIRLTILTLGIVAGVSAPKAYSQMPVDQLKTVKQIPAALPKLALLGAVGDTKAGVPYHKIVLAITNWDKYPSEMFLVPVGRKLPPNTCREVKARVVISVYSNRGSAMAECISMPRPADLGRFTFQIQKGKSVPDFVYAVITDRHTGAVYRSNLVSPWTGATK